jgi:thioredoxin-dependent peroxiredoxin
MRTLFGLIGSLLMSVAPAQAATLKVGDIAPDFSAPSSAGTTIHLKDSVGKAPIIVYFYPKNDTPGCTKEACSLRDNFAAFRKLDARVYGISYDSVESHQEFVKKYNLPFPLISDVDKKISKAYGADGLLFAKRMTFVIGLDGKIAYIDSNVSPETHGSDLEAVLQDLQATIPTKKS